MNEITQYIRGRIELSVWSGFFQPDDVQEMITDLLEEDGDEELLRSLVLPEFEKKRLAERSWPARTDCNRMDEAFAALNAEGIVALHNAGYTMSDGIGDVAQEIHQRGRDAVRGYCFYHFQDVERAINGHGLSLAFGDLNDDPAEKRRIGEQVQQAVEAAGFAVEWSGDPERRIEIPKFDWKWRTAE